jgi:hypothetical protein
LSYEIIKKGKKATLNRGWGPLNYALLKNPDILSTKESQQKKARNLLEGEVMQMTTPSIMNVRSYLPGTCTQNTKKGYAAELLEGIVREVMKDNGRKEKIWQKRQQQKAVTDTAKKLKEMTKVMSGGLASHMACMYQIVVGVHSEIKERKEQRMTGDAQTQEKCVIHEGRIIVSRQVAHT